MMSKTIISLTILPSRINNTKKCINSLLNQTLKPDAIYIWHPQNCRRDKTVINNYPEFLNHPLIKNYKTEDKGPITKILPTLELEWKNKDYNIVTADDDVIYPSNWLETLVDYSNKIPNSVICYRGRNFNKTLQYNKTSLLNCNNVKKPEQVSIVTGTWGALYKPKFFNQDFFSVDLNSKFFYVDDIWISGQLKKNNINAYVVPNNKMIIPDETHSVTSLWEINRVSDNNDYGIQHFKKYFLS